MNRKLPNEFLFTIVALLVSIVLVHSVYVLHVRPVAEATLQADRERMAADPNYVSQRSLEVVLKDYEQEAEVILMFWALAIMGYKAIAHRRE
ncbi:MAG: MotA/TolQ/ExbB proton channel family protein, partial [Gammaproteobacteria bacterium]|nr:MotA/TolQ/ExbB proton channel family protein [Gammaproteobacteria bacterium]